MRHGGCSRQLTTGSSIRRCSGCGRIRRTASVSRPVLGVGLRRDGVGAATGAGRAHRPLRLVGPEHEQQPWPTVPAPVAEQAPADLRDRHLPSESGAERVGVERHVPAAREAAGDQGEPAVLDDRLQIDRGQGRRVEPVATEARPEAVGDRADARVPAGAGRCRGGAGPEREEPNEPDGAEADAIRESDDRREQVTRKAESNEVGRGHLRVMGVSQCPMVAINRAPASAELAEALRSRAGLLPSAAISVAVDDPLAGPGGTVASWH